MTLPRILITMGDVAGVGPEIIARAWPFLLEVCRPNVVGSVHWLEKALQTTHASLRIAAVPQPDWAIANAQTIPVIDSSSVDLTSCQWGQISGAAGRAAYDFLVRAIDLCLAKEADAVVTAPLHKEGLAAGGLSFPGHTEILAERTGTANYGMMLYAENDVLPHGLGVVHVTLHCAMREIFPKITRKAVVEKAELLHNQLTRLLPGKPAIAIAGLNPHASDGGLFGHEEIAFIEPAVEMLQSKGYKVTGPVSGDTLFIRAREGEFQGVVAMYHDQGHIPMKLLAGWDAVNITVGLPIVRTSVAHGTAYDLAGRGLADPKSLIAATKVAAKLA